MRRFHFKLDPLLSVRKRKEEQAKLALGREQLLLNNEVVERTRLIDKKSDVLNEIHATARAGCHIGELVDMDHYYQQLNWNITQQDAKIKFAHSRVETARKKMVETMRDRRIIERIREKKYDIWRKEFEAEEAAEIDEYARRRAYEGMQG